MSGQPSQIARIFISHSSVDNDFGVHIANDLCQSLGDDIAWYDTAGGLLGGEVWWDKIVTELTARPIFVLVLSPDAMQSEWVRREFLLAFLQRKQIIPLLYRQSSSVWEDVKLYQRISFLSPKTYEQAFNELLIAIRQRSIFLQKGSAHLSPTTANSISSPNPPSLPGLDNAECARLKRKHTLTSTRLRSLERRLEYLYKVLASRAPGSQAYELQADVEEAEKECRVVEQQIEKLERRMTVVCE